MVKVTVLKTGTISLQNGDYRINQHREIFVIYKSPRPEDVAGEFEYELPENFNLYGGNAGSIHAVTQMLKKAKEIAGV